MTLKEKFKIINCKDCDMPYCDTKCTILAPSELIKLEQIADEFAIGFAEFSINYNYHPMHKVWIRYDKMANEKFTTKELLEIYKKEKGL